MGMIGLSTSRITIRFNKKEEQQFASLKSKHQNLSNSRLIKELIFRDIKPFLKEEERETLSNYIYELNAIGRNLNQLIKYKSFKDCEAVISDIKDLINEAKKVL